MADCDVAVAGGGPAGATVARLLARAGLRTMLVSWPAQTASSSYSVETLALTASPKVQHLSAAFETGRIPSVAVSGFHSNWGGAEMSGDALLRPDGFAVALDRPLLDAHLLEAAGDAGARIIRAKVIGCVPGPAVWLLTTSAGDEFSAHKVVDATGRRAALARRAGARLVAVDKMVAYGMCVAQRGLLPADRSARVEALSKGWLLELPAPSGRRLMCYYGDGPLWGQEASAREVLLSHIRESSSWSAGGPPVSAIKAFAANTQILDMAVLDGLVAIGDAAQTQDPLSSSGISNAVNDAHAVTAALISAFDGDTAALSRHEGERRLTALRYLKRRQAYYALETRWADQAFWASRASGNDVRRALPRLGWRAGA